jgi:hypothetical protein
MGDVVVVVEEAVVVVVGGATEVVVVEGGAAVVVVVSTDVVVVVGGFPLGGRSPAHPASRTDSTTPHTQMDVQRPRLAIRLVTLPARRDDRSCARRSAPP